jgi:hypothetical protein
MVADGTGKIAETAVASWRRQRRIPIEQANRLYQRAYQKRCEQQSTRQKCCIKGTYQQRKDAGKRRGNDSNAEYSFALHQINRIDQAAERARENQPRRQR